MFKKSHLALLLGLIAPVSSFAAHYCVAVNGGFGHGGTTFIGTGFTLPAEGTCTPWSGFTKTASTVILTTGGTGCLSSDSKVFTLSVSSADPMYYGQPQADFIQFCPANGGKDCPIGDGRDTGINAGSAAPVSCSSSLEQLPSYHD